APGGEALDYLEALLSTIKVEEIVPASDLAPPEASAGDSTKEEQPPPAEESDEIELKDLLAVLAHEEHLDELLTSCEKKRPAFHTRAAPAGTHTTQATAALTASTSRGHAENTARQMPEVDAALWQEAESAFQASTDQSSLELEIGLNEICEMPQNQTLSLLFEVLDEELSGLRDGARQLAAPLRSEDRRVDNRALAAAVHNYQAEEKLRTAQSHDKSTFDDDGLPAYLTAAPLWRRASGAAFDALFAALAGVVFAWLAVLPEEFKQALVNAELPLLIEALPHGLDVMLIVYCSWLLLPMLSIGFTGRTFGGRIVSTAIVNIQGGPPSFAQAVVRSCAQGATLLSLGLGLLPLLGRNRQTLHDILAATCVVYQSEE
ncbi:MAG TPA: RDD family protein, partial [Oligoflexia bacterium]|nr:RDD family protein [Oligoflexia bacterium]